MTFEDARKVCKLRVARPKDFACVQLVYGHAGEMEAVYPDCRLQVQHIPPHPPPPSSSFLYTSFSLSGDGKTHYIQQQLAHSPVSLTISVNEAFTPLNAISKLRSLLLDQNDCAIFFNFTMLPPGVREVEGGEVGVGEVKGGEVKDEEVKGEIDKRDGSISQNSDVALAGFSG